MSPEARSTARRPRPSLSDDLALHLMREHTLLQILAERMQELAAYIDRGGLPRLDTIQEGLEVHHQLLVRVHHAKEGIVAAALSEVKGHGRGAALAECNRQHPQAIEFEKEMARLLLAWPKNPGKTAAAVAVRLKKEAERITSHHRAEEEKLYNGLEKVLPAPLQRKAVEAVKALSAESAAAEAKLQAWASRAHPASD
jgi:hemerythrin-like domain-containing protein